MNLTKHTKNPLPAASDDRRPDFFRELQIEFLIHELKGPVSVAETGIRTLLEQREKFGPLSPRQEKTLKRALRNIRKTRQMMHHLLEIGRSQSGCFACACFFPAEVVFDTLVEALEVMQGGICEQLAAAADEKVRRDVLTANGIHLVVDASALQVQVLQDEIKFRQIVGNLIKNALHYRRQTLRLHLTAEGGRVVFEVCDDGPGIAPRHHEMVFRRYAQIETDGAPNRSGHGLGLAGALVLAKSMGGDIELESKKGRGATFRLILPVSMAQTPAEQNRNTSI